MKELYAVLLQKERDLLRVRREIEALRFVIPLLSDDVGQVAPTVDAAPSTARQKNKWPLEVQEVR
jgi:hypothetical protein